jgi:hypothetical protein
MPFTHTVTLAHLPRDIYQRRERYWPESRQKPAIERIYANHS